MPMGRPSLLGSIHPHLPHLPRQLPQRGFLTHRRRHDRTGPWLGPPRCFRLSHTSKTRRAGLADYSVAVGPAAFGPGQVSDGGVVARAHGRKEGELMEGASDGGEGGGDLGCVGGSGLRWSGGRRVENRGRRVAAWLLWALDEGRAGKGGCQLCASDDKGGRSQSTNATVYIPYLRRFHARAC